MRIFVYSFLLTVLAFAEDDSASRLEKQHKQRVEQRTRDEVRRWSDLLQPMTSMGGNAKVNPGENPQEAIALPAMNKVAPAPTVAPVNLEAPPRAPAEAKPAAAAKREGASAADSAAKLLSEPPNKVRFGFLYVDKPRKKFLSMANHLEAARFSEASTEDICLKTAYESLQKLVNHNAAVRDQAEALVAALDKAGQNGVREQGVRLGARLWVEPNGETSLSLMRDPEDQKSREIYTYSNGLRVGILRKPGAPDKPQQDCEVREEHMKTLLARLIGNAERLPANSISESSAPTASPRSR